MEKYNRKLKAIKKGFIKIFFNLKKNASSFFPNNLTRINIFFYSQGFQKRGFNIDNSKTYQYGLPKNFMRLIDDVGHFDFSVFVYI